MVYLTKLYQKGIDYVTKGWYSVTMLNKCNVIKSHRDIIVKL